MQQAPVTIIIKTFERPASLIKLLHSIRALGLTYPIIIADDSRLSLEKKIKSKFPDLPISWIAMPFDSGLSAGRNALVQQVSTPYFLLCDDDFVFDERANIRKALECVQAGHFDILGGDFYNYITIPSFRRLVKLLLSDPLKIKMFLFKEFKTSRYLGRFILSQNNSCELVITNKKPLEFPYRCDLVNNFFLAATASIKKMGGWDSDLKLGEHEDFFLRAKLSGLSVAYLADFGTGHFPVIRSDYKKYRLRADEYKNSFVRKHKFRQYTERLLDTNQLLFEARI